MEELKKESCFCSYHFYSPISYVKIEEQVHVMCLSPVMNVIDTLLL